MKSTLALTVLVCLTIPFLSAADWNQWRGPDGNGLASDGPRLIDQLPQDGLQPLWVQDTAIPAVRNGGWSSPVVADGRLFLFTHKKNRLDKKLPTRKYPWLPPEKRGGMTEEQYAEYEQRRRDEEEALSRYFRYDEVTYCLDAAGGQVVWTNERPSVYTRFAQSGTPAVVDGRLYVLGAGRVARCVDAVRGDSLWQTPLPGEFRDEYLQSSIAVADGVAVVLCGRLFGLDIQSGRILWQGDAQRTRGVHTSPVVYAVDDQQLVIVNVAGGSTICVDPKTGQERWRVKSDAGHSTPVIAGNHMITYGSSRKKGMRCFAISAAGAERVWTFQGAADPGSSPVVVDGYVYVQGARRLACVDLETGRAKWNTTLDIAQPRYTSLVAADGKVIYAFDGVLCFSASPDAYQQLISAKIDETGRMAEESVFRRLLDLDRLETTAEGQKEAERIWRKKFNNSGPLPCSTPAIAGGKLYVRLKSGVACYDLAAAQAE